MTASIAQTVGLTLESGWMLLASMGLIAATVIAALLRRIKLPAGGSVMLLLGAIALALAAGGLTWVGPRAGKVVVMLDQSPSTRVATYHNPERLEARLATLLKGTAFTVERMSALDAPKTEFVPPANADAIVLFSDGQFELPKTAPPTYVVIDPALDEPGDSAIERLEIRDGGVCAVRSKIALQTRKLTWAGVERTEVELPVGETVVTSAVADDAKRVAASVFGRDAWAENDALAIEVPPPVMLERWWVGTRDPGAGWKRMSPSDLPAGESEYLSASVVVLDNVSADAVNRRLQECIEQYVRELGGGVVIVGGDRAFAAGGYPGSAMESISPLSSTPPRPTAHWVLLGDSSGSMASGIGDNTRWDFAARSMRDLLRYLPQDDVMSMGNFAKVVRWWRTGRSVREVQGFVPPIDISPTGPTNLAPVLEQLAINADPSAPMHVLLITDAQAKIDGVDSLGDALRKANIHVHVMGTGAIPPENAVRKLVEATGGTIVSHDDPREWAGTYRKLLHGALPKKLENSTLKIAFTNAGPALAPLEVTQWNRTWLKPDATELATGTAGEERVPAIAASFVGDGAVIATAFEAPIPLVTALAERVALPPRDPRYTVTWTFGPKLIVRLDAIDGDAFMNDLKPRLEFLTGERGANAGWSLVQIGPGRYETAMDAPARPALGVVRLDGQMIDRRAIPGRYPAEFDAIGNNRTAMAALSKLSGGAVIEPSGRDAIDFRWKARAFPLRTWLGLIGVVLVASGLVAGKRGV